MAHLSDDRGQIILVAAFALGVIFIALAVVVNAAIFTENLATRGEATSDSDALTYRYELEESVGRALTYVNTEASSGVLVSTLETRVNVNITDISNLGGREKATFGRAVTVSNVTWYAEGTRFENSTSTFESANGDATWALATNTDATRKLVLNVTDTSELAVGRDGAFNLSVQAGNDYWNLTVFNDTTTGPVNVTVTTGTGDVAYCTRAVSEPFTIAVTEGLVAGQRCPALRVSDNRQMWFGTGVSEPYSIVFDNATSIEGGYSGIINGTNIGLVPGTPASTTTALYSLKVGYRYETPSLRYQTAIRVAPGEPAS